MLGNTSVYEGIRFPYIYFFLTDYGPVFFGMWSVYCYSYILQYAVRLWNNMGSYSALFYAVGLSILSDEHG